MSGDHPCVTLEALMSDESVQDEYPFDYIEKDLKLTVGYDGEEAVIISAHKLKQESDTEWQGSAIRIHNWREANMLVLSLLALLEAYGQPNLLNDEDIQDSFTEVLQEAKETYAEEAFKQIREGLGAN